MKNKKQTISKKTLQMMDESMKNFAKGITSEPVNIKHLKKVAFPSCGKIPKPIKKGFNYKVRTEAGFTGVSLYENDRCLDTITQHVANRAEVCVAERQAEQLNSALDKGRLEVLKVVGAIMSTYICDLKLYPAPDPQVVAFVNHLETNLKNKYEEIIHPKRKHKINKDDDYYIGEPKFVGKIPTLKRQ